MERHTLEEVKKMEAFGKLLRQLREESKKSMGELARYLGVTVPYVSAVEHSERPPFITEKIYKTAAFLNVPVEPLLIAAATDGRAFELIGTKPMQLEVGAALQRSWDGLSEDALRQIKAAIEKSSRG